MSKRNRVFLILLVVINVLYFGFLGITKLLNVDTNNLPVISFDKDLVTISVKDDLNVLLKGVKAIDEEDGDITNNVFIYDISMFDENNERTVTYGVFDSNNQMMVLSRKFKYSDYVAPRFHASKPLFSMLSELTSNDSGDVLQANSCVDGDITSKISITQTQTDNQAVALYSVTDSTGTTETFTIKESINFKELFSNITIELSNYIVYVDKNDDIDFRSYISNVKTSIGYQEDLIYSVDIESNLDSSKPGVYEVVYTLNRSNGDYGTTKMYVIVED